MSAKIKSLPGTAISPEELESGRFSLEDYEARLSYAWSSGIAIGRFLRELKNGEIWGRRCNRCRRTIVPPRMYCENCFRPTDSWVKVGDKGNVNTYSICWVNADASRRKEPLIIGVVMLDGASENMGMLHYLAEVEPRDVRIGMKVKAVWRAKEERTGSVLDIKYFKPV